MLMRLLFDAAHVLHLKQQLLSFAKGFRLLKLLNRGWLAGMVNPVTGVTLRGPAPRPDRRQAKQGEPGQSLHCHRLTGTNTGSQKRKRMHR